MDAMAAKGGGAGPGAPAGPGSLLDFVVGGGGGAAAVRPPSGDSLWPVKKKGGGARAGAVLGGGRVGAAAVVGGAEYAVGGWADYVIDSRRAAAVHGGGGRGGYAAHYPGRTKIGAGDVIGSVLGGVAGVVGGGGGGGARGRDAGAAGALSLAAGRLARALTALESRLCDGDECDFGEGAVVPRLVADDLWPIERGEEWAVNDPETIRELVADAVGAAADAGRPVADLPPDVVDAAGFPPLPVRVVRVNDTEAVARLEEAVGPYIASLEKLQAAAATKLDEVAAAVEAAERAARAQYPG